MEQLRAAPSVQGPSRGSAGGGGGVAALISGLVPSPASAVGSGANNNTMAAGNTMMRSGGSSGDDGGGGGGGGGFSSDTPGQSVGAEVSRPRSQSLSPSLSLCWLEFDSSCPHISFLLFLT